MFSLMRQALVGAVSCACLANLNKNFMVTGSLLRRICPLLLRKLWPFCLFCKRWLIWSQTLGLIALWIVHPWLLAGKKDDSRNPHINNVLKEVFHLTLSANLHVTLHFVPSQENPADSPSCIPSDRECMLIPASWQIIQRAFGPHTIDLMVTSDNVQRDLSGRVLPFFTLSPLPRALGVNVFSQVMVPSYICAYVFPPLCLLAP